MATFLVKTEPGDYSFADLMRDKGARWSGVSNPAALLALRSMKKGDEVLVYHTGGEKAVVGLAKVARAPYEDPDRRGLTPEGLPKFAVVDLVGVRVAASPVPLSRIKADKRFADLGLVRQPRLSVMGVPPALDKVLREWAGL